MSTPTSHARARFGPLAGIVTAGAVIPVVIAAGLAGKPPAPVLNPALPGALANSVVAFGAEGGHPEFAVLRDNRTDAAAYLFGHKNHNSPDAWGRMQEALAAIKDGSSPTAASTGRAGHIEDRGGKLAMSCTFCHEPEPDRGGMKPIDFETHCIDCHAGSLGFVGAAGDKVKLDASPKKLVRAHAVPHGSSAQVAALVDLAIAQFVADDPPQFPKPDPAKAAGEGEKKDQPATDEGGSRRRRGGGGGGGGGDEAAKPVEAPAAQPEEPSSGSTRRGRGGSGGDTRRPADAGPTAKLKAYESKDKLIEDMKEWRTAILGSLKDTNCAMCHTDVKAGAGETPDLFVVAGAPIPDRWFARARFDHGAHAMVSCISCHNDAIAAAKRFPGILASEKTADINIPGIASCRECHAPAGATVKRPDGSIMHASGAPHDCVLCHTYHEKPPQAVMGRRSIEQVRNGGRGAPAGTAPSQKPPAPSK